MLDEAKQREGTMPEQARVHWKISKTGVTGHGQWMDVGSATSWVESLNKEKGTEHWIEHRQEKGEANPMESEPLELEAQHTETPWRWWDEDTDRPKGYDLASLQNDDGENIFTLYGGAGLEALGTEPQDIANATFIVRACNSHEGLLKACRQMVEIIGNSRHSHVMKLFDYDPQEFGEKFEQWSAIVALAEGR